MSIGLDKLPIDFADSDGPALVLLGDQLQHVFRKWMRPMMPQLGFPDSADMESSVPYDVLALAPALTMLLTMLAEVWDIYSDLEDSRSRFRFSGFFEFGMQKV